MEAYELVGFVFLIPVFYAVWILFDDWRKNNGN